MFSQVYNVSKGKDYLIEHPEVKRLIADYTQALLVGNQLTKKIGFLPCHRRKVFFCIKIDSTSAVTRKRLFF